MFSFKCIKIQKFLQSNNQQWYIPLSRELGVNWKAYFPFADTNRTTLRMN